jgi:hypothetical protein
VNNNKNFDNALDECLKRLLIDKETVEQCLKSYPEYSERLRPLLETALFTRKSVSVKPGAEFRQQARHQLQSVLRKKKIKETRPAFNWGWQHQWGTVVAVFLVISLVGSGTVVAARGSMPDSPLYGLKQATEKIQLAITFSGIDKAELNAKLADKRVSEIVYLADKNEPAKIAEVTENLNTHLAEITSMAAAPELPAGAESSPAPLVSASTAPPQQVEPEEVFATGETGAGQEPALYQAPPASTAIVSPSPSSNPVITTPPAVNTTATMPTTTQTWSAPALTARSTANMTVKSTPIITTPAPDQSNFTGRNMTANMTTPDTHPSYPVYSTPATTNKSSEKPAVVLTPAPAVTALQAASNETGESWKDKDGKHSTDDNDNKFTSNAASRRAKLKTTVENQATTNIARLNEVLKTAPESSKPALRATLDQSQKEYDKAVRALDKH